MVAPACGMASVAPGIAIWWVPGLDHRSFVNLTNMEVLGALKKRGSVEETTNEKGQIANSEPPPVTCLQGTLARYA